MKITAQAKRRLLVFGPISVFFVLFFIFTLGSYINTIYQLENQTNKLEKLYNELQDTGENLKIEINKLQDPEYVARYARENYDYSKDGEIIIKISSTNDEIDNLNNKEYSNKIILIILAFILLLMIFIYILGKGSTKKNKIKKVKH